jgi:hypothetical protein
MDIEYSLLEKSSCNVYRVPAITQMEGHRASNWNECIGICKCQIIVKVKLIDF